MTGKTERDYATDVMLRYAIERQFEIIGEATKRLHKANPDLAVQISNHGKIIALRNLLIHDYDIVSDSVVWNTVENDLPLLRADIQRLHDFDQDTDA